MVLIALFVYLGSIGSVVGNTIGWYTLGRPLVASFVVGLIMGDVQTAMIVGILLSFLLKKNWYVVIFLAGFVMVTYFKLPMMGAAVIAAIIAVVYFMVDPSDKNMEVL